MTTIDEVTEAVRAWGDRHIVLPHYSVMIFEGEYDDGTRVVVGFTPDMFGAALDKDDATHEPKPGILYRLTRNGRYAVTSLTPEFLGDAGSAGLAFVHRSTMRTLDKHQATTA